MLKLTIGQAASGVLKDVVRIALPVAEGASGVYLGVILGAKTSSGFASAAGDAPGLELEALPTSSHQHF
jgi:hypothetical protein